MSLTLPTAEEMQPIALLARQVAHDFNNYLSSILGYAGLLKSKCEGGDPRLRYASMIETAGTECGASSERLLTFGRIWTTPPTMTPVDLEMLQEDIVARLTGGHITPRADVHAQRCEGQGRFAIDLRQLQWAMEALAANACEAQPEVSPPFIEVQFHLTGDADLPSEPSQPSPTGQWLRLVIIDRGKGMDPETFEQAFRPGFTTHAGARRQGLGLPTALGFVHSHHGVLDAESSPERGTEIRIWLPVHPPRAS